MSASPGRQFIELLESIVPAIGTSPSSMEGIRFLRGVRLADLSERGPVIVAGQFTAADTPQCLVLPSALTVIPHGCACAKMAMQIDIDVKVAAELVLQLGAGRPAGTSMPGDGNPMALDDPLASTLVRLLQAMRTPTDARVLGPGIARELLYRILVGPQGWAVHAALGQHRHVSRIGKALRRIHAEFHRPVDVPTLAREAGMSVTAFHSNFKALTMTTPIQYLKCTRLRHAQLLMARDGISAATVARMVGYESCSQFSREFKRFFGRSPARDAMALREMLTPEHTQDASIVIK